MNKCCGKHPKREHHGHHYRVRCEVCGWASPWFDRPMKAAEWWDANPYQMELTRPDTDGLPY